MKNNISIKYSFSLNEIEFIPLKNSKEMMKDITLKYHVSGFRMWLFNFTCRTHNSIFV